jgi:hypothetical protein
VVPRTWHTLVQEAELPIFSYALQLYQESHDIGWDQAMGPTSRFLSKITAGNHSPEGTLWYYADSLDKNMFLAVIDNKWEVLHSMRRCTPVQGNGGRLTWLQGDRKLLFGSLVPPPLFLKAQHTNTQADLFQSMSVRAPSLDALVATFDADPTRELGNPSRGPLLHGWPLLPIHPKIACLYMSGLSLAQGLKVGKEILGMIPDHLAAEKILWADQLRVGATRRAANMPISALNVTWTRVDPFGDPDLANWYFSLLTYMTNPLPVSLAPPGAGLALGEPPRGEDPGALPPFGGGARLPLERNNEGALGEPPRGDDPRAALGEPPRGDDPRAELPLDAARGGDDGLLFPTRGANDRGPPLLLAGAQGADISNATLDLLQAMTEKLSNSSARSNSRRYDWTELEYIFERIGAPKVNGSFTGLGEESVPDFFQALSAVRGEKANTRMFAERYRTNHYPKDAGQYDFVWTTQLIKDLKTLSLSGDDLTVSYPSRYRGLSVFSLAPLSEANLAAGSVVRQKMLQFEATEGNHGPAEASEMAKLSVPWNSVPGSRQEAEAWVEHITVMTEMILGDSCPINQYLARLRFNIRRQHLFLGWNETEWKAFIWSLHVAYRAFMSDLTTHPMSFLSSEIEARKRPDVKILPEELKAAGNALTLHGENLAQKRQAEQQRNGQRLATNPPPDGLAAHLTSMLALAKPRTTKDLKVSVLFPADADAARVVGPEFMSLVVPRGQSPCWRHHIYAACHTPGCRYSHTLRQRLTPQLVAGISQRMQARLDAIIREFPKA